MNDSANQLKGIIRGHAQDSKGYREDLNEETNRGKKFD